MDKTEQKYFEKLQASRKEAWKVFSDDEYIGVMRSVIDKYTESAHFVYELLQNADDALATKAEFRLSKEGLYFIHNGSIRFSISNPDNKVEDKSKGNLGHLNSITSIGFSAKDNEGKFNKIGKFGIGFKAVFQYTDTPHIYDDGMCFKIENYIVPSLIEDAKDRKKGETMFYFPFDKTDIEKEDAYLEISNRLHHLDNPILFLHNLGEVKWKDESQQGKYSQKVSKHKPIRGVDCDFVILENSFDNSRKRLWKFTRQIEIESKKYPICIGFYTKKRKNRYRKQVKHLLLLSNETKNGCLFYYACTFCANR